jgi:hypothetical protein
MFADVSKTFADDPEKFEKDSETFSDDSKKFWNDPETSAEVPASPQRVQIETISAGLRGSSGIESG